MNGTAQNGIPQPCGCARPSGDYVYRVGCHAYAVCKVHDRYKYLGTQSRSAAPAASAQAIQHLSCLDRFDAFVPAGVLG